MKQRLALFSLLVFCPMACKSLGRQDANASLSSSVDLKPAQTYAMLAEQRLRGSFAAVQNELDALTPDVSPSASDRLLADLGTLQDMLELFVHALPTRDDEDPYRGLDAKIEAGKMLVLRFQLLGTKDKATLEAARTPMLAWAASFSSAPFRQETDSYLASMNKTMATRRSIPVLEPSCWGHVDYIPDLRAAADIGLQEFMRALLNATRIEAQKALAIDTILNPDQRTAFQTMRRKTRSILAIVGYFEEVYEDQKKVHEALPAIKGIHDRYEALNDSLLIYDELAKGGKGAAAQRLGKTIEAEWGLIKTWQDQSAKF